MDKIFIFINEVNPLGVIPVALAEDGTLLAQHVCSSEAFISHDMGITSEWKHDAYNEHYPEGWELEYIKDVEAELDEDSPNKLFKKAIEKARKEE